MVLKWCAQKNHTVNLYLNYLRKELSLIVIHKIIVSVFQICIIKKTFIENFIEKFIDGIIIR